ncbi:MAG: hypothetical protein ACREMN_09735, partial [Gemmatimonadales bacterium]
TEPVLRRRRPADGRIVWDSPARMVYDFIRALTRPYPGAFSTLGGTRWWIWAAALPDSPLLHLRAAPGEVVGPVICPVEAACGQLVACAHGSGVILLELEDASGRKLMGRDLSDQEWRGLRWDSGPRGDVPPLHVVERGTGGEA